MQFVFVETPLDPLGDRAQHCVLYQQDSYPAGAVAAVDVMVNLTDDQVQVWVWCHTAAFTDVWDLLSTLFNSECSLPTHYHDWTGCC